MIGLFGRDGRVFSAVDLSAALGFARGDERSGHLLLMRHAHPRTAFRVDRALALMNVITDDDPSAPPPVAQNLVLSYARPNQTERSNEQRRIALLDADRLIGLFATSSRPSGV
ncbi:hypothetical protein GCM10007276_18670 [Agaricicola taiwanensis]|uniref:CheW-like domain-containing protein n=1 Tax=Agaricicola taiwanensis TaxID=591372 RepID=A0A8J2VUI3_9RHOB|nr:hypothetical protein GCM10007276_18670 [Agaricicola taiwanensis]